MKDETEKEIEKKKRLLADYQRIAKLIKPSSEEYEKQINLLLDDLNKLLKKRKKND